MNILVLSPFLPYPLDQGGKIRVFNIVKHLSRSHRVTLAALTDSPVAAVPAPLAELCTEVILVERPARLWPDRIAFFAGSSPYNVIRYRSAQLRRTLRGLAASRRFDLVQIEFSMMWQYADLFPEIPVLLDAHNIEHENVRQIGDSATSPFWRFMYRIEERRLRAVEEAAWRDCACLFAVSQRERDEIARRSGGRAGVLNAANGVDPERFAYRGERRNRKKILFLGGMDYAPNLDAARFFLAEVFPLVTMKEPRARLLLVGRELWRLGDLARTPGVECHESVPEVLPFFYEADLLAVPLRQGAGTRIKVLEAMAAGLPIVATPKGCEGIEAADGRELRVAESPQEFASAALEILADPESGRRLAESARRLVLYRYTWESAVNVMEEIYGELAAKRRAAAGGGGTVA